MKAFKLLASLFLCIMLFLFTACAANTESPYIGNNGNWWINGKDTGVSAQGPVGESGKDGTSITVVSVNKTSSVGNKDTYTITFSDNTTASFTVTNGINGSDGQNGTNGSNGTNGTNGTSITVISFEKTATVGNVDTYTIKFSDNTTSTFTVTNGLNGKDGQNGTNGQNGKDGQDGKDGKDGKDGQSISVISVEKTASENNVDTYTIYFSDNTTATFTVTNSSDAPTTDDDTRTLSDGLKFEPVTSGGVAGMKVIGYSGTDKDVVIPNYVGSVPVISVSSSAFRDNTNITSVSLSSNTVTLDNYVFEGCSQLKSIDFNGASLQNIPSYAFQGTALKEITIPATVSTLSPYCFYEAEKLSKVNLNGAPITEIPDYAFYDTRITDITLPSTVTKLGSYAFGLLLSVNYDNITYFGERAMQYYAGGYVYLSSKVEYVGSYAFASAYVYTEHNTIPETWGSYIAGTDDMHEKVITGASKNSDYIYVKDGASVTVNRYIGTQKRITIPSTIGNLPVTKIGYGFGSITEDVIEIYYDLGLVYNEDYSSYKTLAFLDEVKIPSSVTKIEFSTFISMGTMIFIPSSVNTMWCINDDYYGCNYYAFASTSFPTFKSGFIDDSSSSSTIGSYVRYGIGISPTSVLYDSTNELYIYMDSTTSYSLLAAMDFTAKDITVPAKFNNVPVTVIRSKAFYGLYTQNITISAGIQKIQGYAFDNLSLKTVIIPSSVTTINAYGFDSVCNKFYIGASAKPSEWDSYWAGSSSSSVNAVYGVNTSTLKIGDQFIYYTDTATLSATLVEYIGTAKYIVIPSKIDTYSVTRIKEGFASLSYMTVYIPNSVTKIEYRAFTASSYTQTYFYCAAAAKPEGWDSEWQYNSYSSSYTTVYWSQTIPDNVKQSGDFLYSVSGNTVTLIKYLGSSRTVNIPRTIADKTVTTIKTGFLLSSSYVNVYIPKTVTSIESKAFEITGTSSYSYFYFEGASTSVTLSSNFYYNSYYSTYDRKYTYYNQSLSY